MDQDKNFDLKWNGKRFNVKEYLDETERKHWLKLLNGIRKEGFEELSALAHKAEKKFDAHVKKEIDEPLAETAETVIAKDKFLVEFCSPKDVVTDAGGKTREEAEVTLQKKRKDGWVPIGIKENPLSK